MSLQVVQSQMCQKMIKIVYFFLFLFFFFLEKNKIKMADYSQKKMKIFNNNQINLFRDNNTF